MLQCPLFSDCVGGGRLRPFPASATAEGRQLHVAPSLRERVRVRVPRVLRRYSRILTPCPLGRLCRRRAQPFPRGEGAMPCPKRWLGSALNHSTRDSDTRCLGHIDIACVRVLPVYECCVACIWTRLECQGM